MEQVIRQKITYRVMLALMLLLLGALGLSVLAFITMLVITYYWLCRREEAALAREFGAEYQSYRQRVPLFLPRPLRKEAELK